MMDVTIPYPPVSAASRYAMLTIFPIGSPRPGLITAVLCCPCINPRHCGPSLTANTIQSAMSPTHAR